MVAHHGAVLTRRVYGILSRLPRFDHRTPPGVLPKNGVYVFFELGEIIESQQPPLDRVVRVGSHREAGRFPTRIRQHYGSVHSLRGNKNASVFRKHVGGALLRRENPADPRLPGWLCQGGESFSDVEERVSQTLRATFTFSCIRVDAKRERLALESGLIALLAQAPLGWQSEEWLGRFADRPEIARGGLWNTQHLSSQPLTIEDLDRFDLSIDDTLRGRRGQR
jgi:hypothetical protein